jgi:hypothetical protein
MERADFFKGVSGDDGIDEQEPFAGAHVLLPHGPTNQIVISIRSDGESGSFIWKVTDLKLEILCSPVFFLTGGV